ncbi:MAG: hypothetical protein LBU44_02495 [Mediterranea sp.]|jgi:hypothetical protein|nr:hypothetical protein [Mediterranea sp.]
MKNIRFALLIASLSSLHLFARERMSYEPLDKTDPVVFRGDHIRYKGNKIALNETAFFVDGRLSDADAAKYPFVFNSLNEALKQLKDGSESAPMTLYIAPYVYWIDDPDDPEDRKPAAGSTPFGQVVKCDWLRFYGLTGDPVNVVLAGRRGQTQGAAGNFTLFYFDGNGISSENVTFGNYCNVDLEFPLLPELNRPKRSSTITQAQLIICNSDKVLARNTRFISRLNLCPFAGAKRALFDGCYFECTDDALCSTGLYLNSRFTFFSSKPFHHTQGTGAVFLNCDFDVRTKNRQYLTKVGSPVTMVDCRFKSPSDSLYIGWTQDPADDLRCYQYNVSLNGLPLFINAGKPEATVDMAGKPVLKAYRLEYKGEVVYNTYNLLRGDDDWDPMGIKSKLSDMERQTGKNLTHIPTYLRITPPSASIESGVSSAVLHAVVKRFGNCAYDGEPISWSIRPEDRQVVRLKHHDADNTCEAEGTNNKEEAEQAIVNAATPVGLSSASALTVTPQYLEAPAFISLPRIIKPEKGKLKVDYTLNLEGRSDQSLITWYRCSEAKGGLCIPVLVSRLDRPEHTYALSDADKGYYIMAKVAPKHLRCHAGEPVPAVTATPIEAEDVISSRSYSTDFRNFPADRQPRIIRGFWTVDRFKPAGLEAWHWGEPATADAWYYGKGPDGMKGYGLVQQEKGARLLYTPVEETCGDMSVTLNVDPGKTAGQGFGSATGQFMEIYIKYDTRSLTGYGLRIIRTTKYDHAVDFILMKYENGIATPISQPVSAGCYRTDCTIELKAEGNKLTAHVETKTEIAEPLSPGVKKTVDLQADITPNPFGGTGVQHTGTTGAGATMLHRLQLNWEDLEY